MDRFEELVAEGPLEVGHRACVRPLRHAGVRFPTLSLVHTDTQTHTHTLTYTNTLTHTHTHTLSRSHNLTLSHSEKLAEEGPLEVHHRACFRALRHVGSRLRV